MTASAELRALADRYWEARLEANPLFASFLGDHRYDDRADDLSEASEHAQRTLWEIFADEVAAIDTGGLDDTDRVTHELLLCELHDAIEAIDAGLGSMAWDQMDGVHAGLLTMAGQLRATQPDHAAAAVVRIGRLATMLDQATERFGQAVARGRTPARVTIERSVNQLDGYLASDLADDPFTSLAGPEVGS